MSRFDNPIRLYLISFVLFLVVSLLPQLIYTQSELFLYINSLHSKGMDVFFYWVTFLGDGWAFAILIMVLLLFSYREALLGLIIFLITAGIAQFLKRVFFDDQLRPYGKLASSYDLYIPEGVTPLLNNSFPSGHTTTAFALAMFLTLIFSRKVHWTALLLLAILVGYSRIYLTHHFPIDVWTGAIIGTFGALLLFWWLDEAFDKKFGDHGLLRK